MLSAQRPCGAWRPMVKDEWMVSVELAACSLIEGNIDLALDITHVRTLTNDVLTYKTALVWRQAFTSLCEHKIVRLPFLVREVRETVKVQHASLVEFRDWPILIKWRLLGYLCASDIVQSLRGEYRQVDQRPR
jgi:hypothetical protein